MKKLISIALALQILTVSAFADYQTLSDIQKQDLLNYGIMVGDENGDLRLSDGITRAEAVKMLCCAANITLSDEAQIFEDVTPQHWAYKYVCAAHKVGLIIGDESGRFNPDSQLTNIELVKMLICLLGYGDMAEMTGGYPAGYTSLATRLGITANMSLDANDAAIRNDAATMIYNSLDIPMLIKNENETADEKNNSDAYFVAESGIATLRDILNQKTNV